MVIVPLDDHTLCSICFHSFGPLAKAVRLFIESLHNQPLYPKLCSIDIFVNIQPTGWNLKGDVGVMKFSGSVSKKSPYLQLLAEQRMKTLIGPFQNCQHFLNHLNGHQVEILGPEHEWHFTKYRDDVPPQAMLSTTEQSLWHRFKASFCICYTQSTFSVSCTVSELWAEIWPTAVVAIRQCPTRPSRYLKLPIGSSVIYHRANECICAVLTSNEIVFW